MSQLDLSSQIATLLSQYTNDVVEEIDKCANEVADDAVKELQATSPRKTGEYAKNWTKKVDKTGKVIIHSKKRYQLIHLLEFGHAKFGGGRVAPKSHVASVEKKAISAFEAGVIKAIRGTK